MTTAVQGFGTTLTFSHTTSGADRLLNVWVHLKRGDIVSVSSVTYAGTALTFVGVAQNASQVRVELWRLIAPATGANNVVITMTGDTVFVGGAVSFTGVHQTTPLGTFASATGTSTAPSVNVVSAADDLVNDGVIGRENTAPTVGANQTMRYSQGIIDDTANAGGSTEPGAATVTMSWTLATSVEWSIGGVSVKPAVAAADEMKVHQAVYRGVEIQ